MADREYLAGVPQSTPREREWANNVAKVIIDVVRAHNGPDMDELEAQIARELRASVAMLNAGQ